MSYIERPGSREPRTDYRYREQQTFLKELSQRHGLVAFRPEYHAHKRDCNTVLIYLAEDEEHNRMVDQQPFSYTSSEARYFEKRLKRTIDEKYVYRDFIFAFENTDINGQLNYGFANYGRLDLRGRDWKEILENAILAAKEARLNAKVSC